MNSKGNPVLIEMASQLPEASKLYQLVMTSVDYSTIFDQAKEDFFGFADLEIFCCILRLPQLCY